jgi:hypothetical protein
METVIFRISLYYSKDHAMMPNLTETIIILAATPLLMLITFLPALIELKKPRDSGPRMIPMENSEISC